MNLQVTTQNGTSVIDSRDVAEAIGKNHKELLRDIRNYSEIIENSNERNFALVDFFIPSNYTDTKGEQRPCYLLTKKGCDMVANKMTGEKGVLFTAAYVTAFEKMREAVNYSNPQFSSLSPQTQALINMELRQNRLEADQQQTRKLVRDTLTNFGATPTDEERWRAEINRRIGAMCEEYSLNYHTTIGDMYAELERRAHVNLATRQKNLRARMRRGGATVAECRSASKLTIVSQDTKLRYMYEAIVREKEASIAVSRLPS